MPDKIAISDKKAIRVDFDKPEEFDDVDLLSPEEKAALEEDVDLDGPPADAIENDADTRAQARERAEKEAADAKAADEARKAEKAAEAEKEAEPAAKDKKPEAAADPDTDKTPVKIVPDTAPPPIMRGLTEEEKGRNHQRPGESEKGLSRGRH